MDVRSSRSFVFAAPPGQVWDAISDPTRFPGWWPWLRTFEGETQAFKVPHLRNVYAKVGMFGSPSVGVLKAEK